MAETISVYPKYLKNLRLGLVNLTSDTIKVMLVDTAFAFSNTDEFVSSISAAEYNSEGTGGLGYSPGFSGTGRVTLANKTLTTSAQTDTFDADDSVFTSLNTDGTAGNVKGAVIYDHKTSDADSILIAYIAFSSAYTPDGTSLTVKWASSGILTGTAT